MSIFRQTANIPVVSNNNIGSYPIGTFPGTLILNGSFINIPRQASFINNGYASGLSFTSAGNLSAYTFIVTGTFNGSVVQENITGPNANTVYTTNIFHTINSVILVNQAGNIPVTSAFTIGSNYNIAVILYDGNSKGGLTHPNYTYSILLNSLTAAGQWAAGSAIIYGISNNAPVSLQVANLTYATRLNNYFSLPVTGAALAAITQAQLNNGLIIQTTYPYAAIVVYLAAGINTTPAYIEITQS